ncbi:unnamed protein product, partial [marine sediment metagenome]
NSGALTDTIANDDYVDLESAPDSFPTGGDVFWGWVNYIAPPAAGWTGTISGVMDPSHIMGVDVANIAEVKGVASA